MKLGNIKNKQSCFAFIAIFLLSAVTVGLTSCKPKKGGTELLAVTNAADTSAFALMPINNFIARDRSELPEISKLNGPGTAVRQLYETLFAPIECFTEKRNGIVVTAKEKMRVIEDLSAKHFLFIDGDRKIVSIAKKTPGAISNPASSPIAGATGENATLEKTELSCGLFTPALVHLSTFKDPFIRLLGFTSDPKSDIGRVEAAYTLAQAFFLAARGPYGNNPKKETSVLIDRFKEMAALDGLSKEALDQLQNWFVEGDPYFNPCDPTVPKGTWLFDTVEGKAGPANAWKKKFSCSYSGNGDKRVGDYQAGSNEAEYKKMKDLIGTEISAANIALFPAEPNAFSKLDALLASGNKWTDVAGDMVPLVNYLNNVNTSPKFNFDAMFTLQSAGFGLAGEMGGFQEYNPSDVTTRMCANFVNSIKNGNGCQGATNVYTVAGPANVKAFFTRNVDFSGCEAQAKAALGEKCAGKSPTPTGAAAQPYAQMRGPQYYSANPKYDYNLNAVSGLQSEYAKAQAAAKLAAEQNKSTVPDPVNPVVDPFAQASVQAGQGLPASNPFGLPGVQPVVPTQSAGGLIPGLASAMNFSPTNFIAGLMRDPSQISQGFQQGLNQFDQFARGNSPINQYTDMLGGALGGLNGLSGGLNDFTNGMSNGITSMIPGMGSQGASAAGGSGLLGGLGSVFAGFGGGAGNASGANPLSFFGNISNLGSMFQ